MRLLAAMVVVMFGAGSAYAADKISDIEKHHQSIEAARTESFTKHQAREKELAAQPLPCITPEECATVEKPSPSPSAVAPEQAPETKKVQDEKTERRKGVSTKPYKTAH